MGKLGTTKKIILAAVLFCIAAFSIYSQSNSSSNEQSIQLTENSIVLTDDTVDLTANQNFSNTSTVAVFIRMIVVLIIVVVLIYGVFWFIKRKTNIVKTDDDYLRRAAYINIAPGKTIEVITLIDKAYLIGVTEDNISLLGEIQDEELIKAMNLSHDKKANTKKPANFSEVLDMFLVKNNRSKNIFSDTENQVDNLFTNNSSVEDGTEE